MEFFIFEKRGEKKKNEKNKKKKAKGEHGKCGGCTILWTSLFCNPPFLEQFKKIDPAFNRFLHFLKGKTLYYEKIFLESHRRVSFEEMKRENNQLSFHKMILHVTKLLRSGQSVVIDDQNCLRRTRRSYINSIRKEIESCKFKCMEFVPYGGILQCLWANEFAFSQKSMIMSSNQATNCSAEKESFTAKSHILKFNSFDQKELVSTFSSEDATFESPSLSEGYSQSVEQVRTKLYAVGDPSCFQRKSLCIDASLLFKFSALNLEFEKERKQQEEVHSVFYDLQWLNDDLPSQILSFHKLFPEHL